MVPVSELDFVEPSARKRALRTGHNYRETSEPVARTEHASVTSGGPCAQARPTDTLSNSRRHHATSERAASPFPRVVLGPSVGHSFRQRVGPQQHGPWCP